ncbi:DOMON-like domain-containing protein [Phenylobacterium sp.]|uniref:DOMON-like domain-containing protein n=1 Tax=Phenylobacterium sp. TaxID=1871053 RepID=UPI002C3DAF57|nr:DOMON-like domain-containing protein [Phenylobacterium sp.]HVI32699.1 DOMON-like domain-containing protein [Phenylobacterium sp.]
MRRLLEPHPESPASPVSSIAVTVDRDAPGLLRLAYSAAGDMAAVSLPPPAAAERADELWRSTCFEAFLRPAGGEAYWEFNFAPSTQWAAYAFDGYRAGMRPAERIAPPVVEVAGDRGLFALAVTLDLSGLEGLAPGGAWRLGLSAVIAGKGGVSYWALAHPPGRPDFHHADCFALEIPATGRT